MKSQFVILKRLAIFAAFFLLISIGFSCHSKNNSPISTKKISRLEKRIIDLENKWLGAYKIGDTLILQNLLVADFQLIYETGKSVNRHELFQLLQKSDYNTSDYQQFTESVVFTAFNQNTAILAGILVREYLDKNGHSIIRLKFSETYIKQKNSWRLAICHFSRIER
jgi:hypothetical protein